MSALVLENIIVKRGHRAILDTVSAMFQPGRLTVVIGPNGAGKSTLLQVAAGLQPIDDGVATIAGRPIAALSRKVLARHRAYLPQNPRVDWAISVERVVALGLTAHLPAFGGLPAVWQPKIEQALQRYDLLALRDRPATQLSGGELARVMIARATVGDTDILIADEPTTGLDPRHALDVALQLRTLADDGRTVIVALHDLNLALRFADDVVALKAGRSAGAGPAATMLTDANLTRLYDVDTRVIAHDGRATIGYF